MIFPGAEYIGSSDTENREQAIENVRTMITDLETLTPGRRICYIYETVQGSKGFVWDIYRTSIRMVE